MSMAEIAAALIGLRETTHKDHQRTAGTLSELEQAVEAIAASIGPTLDQRLAQSAQAFRDVERQLREEYERRINATLSVLIDVVDRLDHLSGTARSTTEPAELQQRLESLTGPADRLRQLLDEAGIRAFDAVGEPYNPHRHEVVQRQHRAECTHEYVTEELRPGYIREGTEHTLVRAKVIVAAPPVMEGSADG